jgi:hypothetical protein
VRRWEIEPFWVQARQLLMELDGPLVSSELEWVNFGPTLHCCNWSSFDGTADDAKGNVLYHFEEEEVIVAGGDEDFSE